MDYYNNVSELIGNTPMVKINSFTIPQGVNIFAKLEYYNPGGSVKDRIGHWIIEKAEKKGILKKGDTIVEATAGNTGIGLALAALQRGYRAILVVPGKFSMEKQVIMKALGAEIINTPTEEGLKGAFNKVEELKNQLGDVFVADQFNNQDNVEAHYLFTGKEIFQQLDGDIAAFVAGAGSGGTLTGVMKYLRAQKLKTKGVLADPVGSIIGGGTEGCYKIEGIGNDFIPNTLDTKYIDEVVKVTDEAAFEMVRQLALKEGLLVGSSSGAAFYSALKTAEGLTKGNVVAIFPDKADRYISKNIFGDI